MSKMTHTGIEVGCAYNKDIKRKLKLRETKNYYISEYGTKYRKGDGRRVGERFAIFSLDISSISSL